MPTIRDIAKAAGVSQGTVSNVINGRGNVSVEKIQLVQQAAERLGYKLNAKAKSLRQGRDRSIALLLPTMEHRQYSAMYEVFQREFSAAGYVVQLYLTGFMEATEVAMLAAAINSRVSAIVTSSCLTDAVSRYREEAPELPLVFLHAFESDCNDTMFAGFRPEQAGRDMAAFTREHGATRIGVFLNDLSLSDAGRFLRGVYSVYARGSDSIRLVACPDHLIEQRAFSFFEPDTAYDYIICADNRREAAVRAAHAYASDRPRPQYLTVSPRLAVTDPAKPVYELDYKRLAHQVVKHLFARLEQGVPLPRVLTMKNDGFRVGVMPPQPARPVSLRMLTLASPSTTALSSLLPHLEKSTGIRLEMVVLPSLRDVYDVIQTTPLEQFDLIRMDVAWMDELAERLFLPLASVPFDWEALFGAVLPQLCVDYSSVNGVRYCIPYDPSTQLMFYRRDLLTDPTYKRMFYEMNRRELAVPRTFAEYNEVARFFTRSFNPASPIRYGTTVAVGNVVVSPSEFIPRLFEEGGRMLDENGAITLNSPAALRALKNYREAYQYSDRTVHDGWKNVLEGFADGSAAMTVVFINYASHILNLKMSSIAGKLGFASVPGDKPLQGGGVIGITRGCRNPEAACTFFQWLYSDLVAPVFTMLGGLSPCSSAYDNRDIKEKYPWLSAAYSSFMSAQRRRSSELYENFSELQLEGIIASHVRKAVLGICSPEEALLQAQNECEQHFVPRRR